MIKPTTNLRTLTLTSVGGRTMVRGAFGTVRMLLGLALVTLTLSASAAQQKIDGIAAIVNDDIILESELVERLAAIEERLAAIGGRNLPPREVIMEQILERLILESLQLQEAELRGVQIDDETLTAAVGTFADQNNMTIDEFVASMEAEGMSYRAFRSQIRREILLQRVQQAVVNRRIYITEEDVKELIASPFFQEMTADEFRLGHILLALPRSASDKVDRETRELAEDIIRRAEQGADFGALAIEHSKASTALDGGDLGWRKASRIPSLFAERVPGMQAGDLAGPFKTASGYHVIKMLDRRGATQQTAVETQVRHILMQPSEIRTPEETRELLAEVRQRVLAGEDFAQLAREFSDDPGSALAGGDLGWSTGEVFVGVFRETMDATEVGQISEIFQSDFGWHFLEVVDRREASRSEEALEDIATRMILERRFDEKLQEWLKEIRDEAFVEVRVGKGAEDAGDDGDAEAAEGG